MLLFPHFVNHFDKTSFATRATRARAVKRYFPKEAFRAVNRTRCEIVRNEIIFAKFEERLTVQYTIARWPTNYSI